MTKKANESIPLKDATQRNKECLAKVPLCLRPKNQDEAVYDRDPSEARIINNFNDCQENIIAKIMSGLAGQYREKSYIHWRDHNPRTEYKARALAAAEAWGTLPVEIQSKLTHEDLAQFGIEALHRLGWPPLCYDDQGDVYILLSNGHRQYTGQTYRRWVRKE